MGPLEPTTIVISGLTWLVVAIALAYALPVAFDRYLHR